MQSARMADTDAIAAATTAHLYFYCGRPRFWPTGRWPPHAKRARLKFDAGRALLAGDGSTAIATIRPHRLNRQLMPRRIEIARFVCGRSAGVVQLDVKWLRVSVEWRPASTHSADVDSGNGGGVELVNVFRLNGAMFVNNHSRLSVVERRRLNDSRD